MKDTVNIQDEKLKDNGSIIGAECRYDSIYEDLQYIAEKLMLKQWTITTVESCTGGGLSSLLTSVAGSSAYINQAFVTYSNEAKQSMVGVKKQTLNKYGAVSKQTVVEMASGGLQVASANIAVAISGIAGPGGGTEDKPVGTVWIAFAIKDNQALDEAETVTYKKHFSGNREEVRDAAICFVIKQLVTDILS